MTEPDDYDDDDDFSDPEHWPMLVYFDAEHLTVPAEVCWTCSDEKTGVWVPVTQCNESKRIMEELNAGQYPNFHPSTTTVLREGFEMTGRTDLEKAQGVLDEFKMHMQHGHPWLPGAVFISNPGLDLYIQAALVAWVHTKQVAEQSKPAERVSLTEVPDGEDADQGQARSS